MRTSSIYISSAFVNVTFASNFNQTIQPTSVESERVFSAAGLFLTKLRSRMSDITIDMLLFMKARLSVKEERRQKRAAREAKTE